MTVTACLAQNNLGKPEPEAKPFGVLMKRETTLCMLICVEWDEQ